MPYYMVTICLDIKKACAQLPQTQQSHEASSKLSLTRNVQASDNNDGSVWRTNCPDLLWFNCAVPNFNWISLILTTDLGALRCIMLCCCLTSRLCPTQSPSPTAATLVHRGNPKDPACF